MNEFNSDVIVDQRGFKPISGVCENMKIEVQSFLSLTETQSFSRWKNVSLWVVIERRRRLIVIPQSCLHKISNPP